VKAGTFPKVKDGFPKDKMDLVEATDSEDEDDFLLRRGMKGVSLGTPSWEVI
jgi:hypothetical protein